MRWGGRYHFQFREGKEKSIAWLCLQTLLAVRVSRAPGTTCREAAAGCDAPHLSHDLPSCGTRSTP
jgi:hypothetical protein